MRDYNPVIQLFDSDRKSNKTKNKEQELRAIFVEQLTVLNIELSWMNIPCPLSVSLADFISRMKGWTRGEDWGLYGSLEACYLLPATDVCGIPSQHQLDSTVRVYLWLPGGLVQAFICCYRQTGPSWGPPAVAPQNLMIFKQKPASCYTTGTHLTFSLSLFGFYD